MVIQLTIQLNAVPDYLIEYYSWLYSRLRIHDNVLLDQMRLFLWFLWWSEFLCCLKAIGESVPLAKQEALL